jgi:hypothetical protein
LQGGLRLRLRSQGEKGDACRNSVERQAWLHRYFFNTFGGITLTEKPFNSII